MSSKFLCSTVIPHMHSNEKQGMLVMFKLFKAAGEGEDENSPEIFWPSTFLRILEPNRLECQDSEKLVSQCTLSWYKALGVLSGPHSWKYQVGGIPAQTLTERLQSSVAFRILEHGSIWNTECIGWLSQYYLKKTWNFVLCRYFSPIL